MTFTKDELKMIETWAYYANQVYEEFGSKLGKEEKKLLRKIEKAKNETLDRRFKTGT